MRSLTRSCFACTLCAILLFVQGVSAASVSLSPPDRVMVGDQVTISIADLPDSCTFVLRIEGTFATAPGSVFSFEARNFLLPFTLNNGSISSTLWNTGTNVMTIRRGDTEVRRVGLSEDGVFSTATSGTIPSGTYDLIALGGTAAPGATTILTSLSLEGTKSGPDDSAITFFIGGVNEGSVTITVFVDGETALSRTIPIGDPGTPTPTPTNPLPTATTPTPAPATPTPTTPTPTPPPPGGTIPLRAGWNFVSVPRTLAEGQDMVEVVFAGVDTGGRSLFTYDGQNQVWRQLRHGDTVRLLDGIWIYSSDARSVPLVYASEGVGGAMTKQLYTGWNTIGVGDGGADVFGFRPRLQTVASGVDDWQAISVGPRSRRKGSAATVCECRVYRECHLRPHAYICLFGA